MIGNKPDRQGSNLFGPNQELMMRNNFWHHSPTEPVTGSTMPVM